MSESENGNENENERRNESGESDDVDWKNVSNVGIHEGRQEKLNVSFSLMVVVKLI